MNQVQRWFLQSFQQLLSLTLEITIRVAVAVAVPNFAANADMPSRIASLPMMMIPDPSAKTSQLRVTGSWLPNPMDLRLLYDLDIELHVQVETFTKMLLEETWPLTLLFFAWQSSLRSQAHKLPRVANSRTGNDLGTPRQRSATGSFRNCFHCTLDRSLPEPTRKPQRFSFGPFSQHQCVGFSFCAPTACRVSAQSRFVE